MIPLRTSCSWRAGNIRVDILLSSWGTRSLRFAHSLLTLHAGGARNICFLCPLSCRYTFCSRTTIRFSYNNLGWWRGWSWCGRCTSAPCHSKYICCRRYNCSWRPWEEANKWAALGKWNLFRVKCFVTILAPNGIIGDTIFEGLSSHTSWTPLFFFFFLWLALGAHATAVHLPLIQYSQHTIHLNCVAFLPSEDFGSVVGAWAFDLSNLKLYIPLPCWRNDSICLYESVPGNVSHGGHSIGRSLLTLGLSWLMNSLRPGKYVIIFSSLKQVPLLMLKRYDVYVPVVFLAFWNVWMFETYPFDFPTSHADINEMNHKVYSRWVQTISMTLVYYLALVPLFFSSTPCGQ